MAKAKSIGTAVESAIVKSAKQLGFPFAERLALKGGHDEGDIRLNKERTVMIEAKGGKMAEKASLNAREKWLIEAETERVNGNWKIGFLVTKRAGVGASNAHGWDAWIKLSQLDAVRKQGFVGQTAPGHDTTVHMTLGSLLALLEAHGWGDEPAEDEADTVYQPLALANAA